MLRHLLLAAITLLLACSTEPGDAPPDDAGPKTPGYLPGEPIGLPLQWSRVLATPPASRPCGATEDGGRVELRYDARGYPASESARWGDPDLARDRSFSYDAAGRLTHFELHWHGVITYDAQYDAGGNLVTSAEDSGGDGVAVERLTVTGRDARGRPTAMRRTVDGVVLYELAYLYDGDGRVIEETVEDTGDGHVDGTRRCVYDDAALVRTCTDTDSADRVTSVAEARYRADLQLISLTVWGDGLARAPSFVGTFTFDASGRALTATLGPSPIRVTYDYACP